MKSITLIALLILTFIPQQVEAGKKAGIQTRELLERAARVIGMKEARDKILHVSAMQGWEMNFQSDRTYPPFFSAMYSLDMWYDTETRVQRTSTAMVFPGMGPSQGPALLVGPDRAGRVRDSVVVPATGSLDYLNVWAVLQDWVATDDGRYGGREVYREFPRDVLIRTANDREERLFLDVKTGFPVKVEWVERHHLWGQVKVEYLYSTWLMADGVSLPSASFKLVDGSTEKTRTLGQMELIERNEGPLMTIPPGGTVGKEMTFLDFPIPPVESKSVSDNVFLSVTRVYTEALTLIDDTVYVFDATTGEDRARQDEELARRLFPGYKHVVVIVTDLAWPHISGVRYWVSRGATIVSHKNSEGFLKAVLERRWSLAPDSYEKNRENSPFHFVPVGDSLALAGGKLRLFAINGIGSEGALMAFLPAEGFLWASDYVQDLQHPSSYAREVVSAARRVGIAPTKVAAQHIPLTEWQVVENLQKN